MRSTLPVLARYGLRLLKGRPPLADVRSGDPPLLLLERAGGACRGAGSDYLKGFTALAPGPNLKLHLPVFGYAFRVIGGMA